MKIQFLFFFLLCSVFAHSQVSENFVKEELKTVLSKLENKHDLKIAYDPALIANVKITATMDNVSIDKALSIILTNTNLSFDQVQTNYYLIRPSNKNWEINGQIIDKNENGIPYAKIRIIGGYKGVYTDVNGRFIVEYQSDIAPMLQISSLGFKKRDISAETITNGKTILLENSSIEINTVIVEYLTEGISTTKDISTILLLPNKIGAVAGTTEPDVFQMVQFIPGINSANSSVSEIQIRGGTSDQNHILWEGIPIYHPGHFNGMFSTINPNIIDKTKLNRGVYDPSYGGKASGLIDLRSINYIPKKIETGIGVNLLQTDAYIKTPIKEKLGLLVSARRSYMDLWKSPTYLRYAERVYQNSNYQEKSNFLDFSNGLDTFSNKFSFFDLNTKLIYKPNKNQLFTISALYTQNGLDYLYFPPLEKELEYYNNISSSNAGININYQQIRSQKWKTSVQLSAARYQSDFYKELSYSDSLEPFESFSKSNDLNYLSLKWKNTFTLKNKQSITAGYQIQYTSVDHTLVLDDTEDTVSFIGTNNGITNAIYANYKYDKKRILMRIGGRISYLNITNDFYVEPRLYAQYSLTENFIFKIGFGMQNQAISQVDQFGKTEIGFSNRVWVMANAEEIPVLKSAIFNSGFRFLHKGWHFEIDVYGKQINNIVNFSEDPALSSGFYRGDAYVRGVDVLIKKRWKNIRSWLSYSYSDVLYDFNSYAINEFPAPFLQPHSIKWINTLTWRQFEFSSAFKIASGKPYTPISNVTPFSLIKEVDPETGVEKTIGGKINYGTQNSGSLPIFHQLDFTVFYSFPKNPDKTWKGKIGLSAINVYNKLNILSRSYALERINSTEEEEFEYRIKTEEKYYLKFTPNLVLRFEF